MMKQVYTIVILLVSICLTSCEEDTPTVDDLSGVYTTFSSWYGDLKTEVERQDGNNFKIKSSAFGEYVVEVFPPYEEEDCYIFLTSAVPLSQFFPDDPGSQRLFQFEIHKDGSAFVCYTPPSSTLLSGSFNGSIGFDCFEKE